VSARRTRPALYALTRCVTRPVSVRYEYESNASNGRVSSIATSQLSTTIVRRSRSLDIPCVDRTAARGRDKEREREREREILEYRHIVPRRRRRNQRSQGTGRAIQQRDARVYRPEIHVQRSSARSLKPRASISIKRNKRQKNKAFVSRYPRAIEGVGAAL